MSGTPWEFLGSISRSLKDTISLDDSSIMYVSKIQMKMNKSRNYNQKVKINVWLVLQHEMLHVYSYHVNMQIVAHNVEHYC